MGNENKALDILVNKIMSACESLIKKYKADHTFKTTIWKVNDDGTYQINYLGQTYNVPSAVGSLKLGQQVWLKIPNGIFREMHIYGTPETTSSGGGENSHKHSNLSVLEMITLALINKWNEAFEKAHIHSNKDSLDTITPEKIQSWDNKSEFDGKYSSLTGLPTIPSTDGLASEDYVDDKIADLINGAPTTLDTLKEIADAMTEHETVVDALDEAIGKKANASDLTNHVNNETVHITDNERTNWITAHTHSQSAHAPSNAEKNQNTFSNVKVDATTISADTTMDTLELVAGDNVTITPDADGNKITISSSVDTELSDISTNPVQNKVITDALNKYVSKSGGVIEGEIQIKSTDDEGGQIILLAADNIPTQNGIIIDAYNGTFRIFGEPSSDGVTHVGSGTVFHLNPYDAEISGDYTAKLNRYVNYNYSIGAYSTSFNEAPFCSEADYASDNLLRAGYGFHNIGCNGTYLFFDTTGRFCHVNNLGQMHEIIDSAGMSHFPLYLGDEGMSCSFLSRNSNNQVWLSMRQPDNTFFDGLIIDAAGDNRMRMFPGVDNTCLLGESSMRWNIIYSASGVSTTSDREKKKDIVALDANKTKTFIMGLDPSEYKFIDGTSGRTHYGLIAQDIEELMKKLGMDLKDFGGIIKSPKKKLVEIEQEDGSIVTEFKEIPNEYDYSLRYEEFIAPLIKVVQSHEQEIQELKSIISDLSQKYDFLLKKYEEITT